MMYCCIEYKQGFFWGGGEVIKKFGIVGKFIKSERKNVKERYCSYDEYLILFNIRYNSLRLEEIQKYFQEMNLKHKNKKSSKGMK